MPVWRTDLEVYLPSRPSDLGNPPFRILLRSCRHGFSLAHHRFRVTDGPLLGSQEVPPAVQKKGPVLRAAVKRFNLVEITNWSTLKRDAVLRSN